MRSVISHVNRGNPTLLVYNYVIIVGRAPYRTTLIFLILDVTVVHLPMPPAYIDGSIMLTLSPILFEVILCYCV